MKKETQNTNEELKCPDCGASFTLEQAQEAASKPQPAKAPSHKVPLASMSRSQLKASLPLSDTQGGIDTSY